MYLVTFASLLKGKTACLSLRDISRLFLLCDHQNIYSNPSKVIFFVWCLNLNIAQLYDKAESSTQTYVKVATSRILTFELICGFAEICPANIYSGDWVGSTHKLKQNARMYEDDIFNVSLHKLHWVKLIPNGCQQQVSDMLQRGQ